MSYLPQQFDADHYWQDLYQRPLPFWQPALDRVAAEHQLAATAWTRASLGRNIVFVSATAVVKFGPPFWQGNMEREAAALRAVAGRLPVATPTPLAIGTLDRWEYLVQAPLPGTNLHTIWKELSPAARATLAEQHGMIMTALHALPVDGLLSSLSFDWQEMVGWQRAECVAEMRRVGVAHTLVEQVESYLDATPWSHEPAVLLHGDLAHLNMLAVQDEDNWRISGLIDWGDVKIGSRMHEFISPGVHMYQGDATALSAWYRGYGWHAPTDAASKQHEIMARSMLYYAEDFARLIETVPEASHCKDWKAMAAAFWHLDAN